MGEQNKTDFYSTIWPKLPPRFDNEITAPLENVIDFNENVSDDIIYIDDIADTQIYEDSESLKCPYGAWGNFALNISLWDDDMKPYSRVKDIHDFNLDIEESRGCLSRQMIATSLSYLERCYHTKEYIPIKVQLMCKSLSNIKAISQFTYLHYIDLSWNLISDASPLSYCPFLMHLNVSHNILTELLEFKPPMNLTYVNYEDNFIQTIPDLSEFWSIVYLDISNNLIKAITGLESLKYLTTLILSYNEIECIENLNNLNIQELDLEFNNIYSYEQGPNVGLKTLPDLAWLQLDNNKLNSLSLFEGTRKLRFLSLKQNRIEQLWELAYLRGMTRLSELDLTENLITEWPSYREACVDIIKSLNYLDGEPIDVYHKITACNLFSPSPSLLAIKNAAKITLMEHLNHPIIDASVVPYDKGFIPFIILVGPSGSRKKHIVSEFVKTYPENIHRVVCHTTKPVQPNTVDEELFFWVTRDKFNEMIENGEFITFEEIRGNIYGISRDQLRIAAEGNKICLAQLNLTSALVLRINGFRPYLILALPRSEETHLDYLKQDYNIFAWNPEENRGESESVESQSSTKCHTMFNGLDNVFDDIKHYQSQNESVSSELDTILDVIHKSREVLNTRSKTLQELSADINSEVMTRTAKNKMLSSFDVNLISNSLNVKDLKMSKMSIGLPKRKSFEVAAMIRKYSMRDSFYSLYSNRHKSMSKYQTDSSEADLDNYTDHGSDKKNFVQIRSKMTYFSDNNSNTKDILDNQSSDISAAIRSKTVAFSNSGTSDTSSITVPRSEDTILEGQCMCKALEESISEDKSMIYFKYVIKSRDIYLNMHETYPGIFRNSIYTDETEKCIEKLKNIVNSIKHETNNPIQFGDYFYNKWLKQKIVEKVSKFEKELKLNRSTGIKQRVDLNTKHNIFNNESSLSNVSSTEQSIYIRKTDNFSTTDHSTSSSSITHMGKYL